MSSNLKVNTILPSTGSNIGIGTNGGELNVDGGCKVQVGTALTLGHSTGVQFSTQNLHSTGFEVNQINASGIVTASHFYGNGANLTSLPSQVTINNAAANRVLTSDGGTTINGEANLTFDGTNLDLASNNYLRLGGGNEFQIWHNGGTGNSNIKQVTGDMYFYTGSDLNMHIRDGTSVDLYYANNKRLETTNAGVECTGNLKFTGSGNGIDFSVGAAGASQSNVLDEYEEGVWTPALTDASSGGGAYVNPPSNMNARYIKIGRLVHLHFGVHAIGGTAAVANFNTSNPIYITGLPFPCLAQHSKHFVSMGYMPTIIEKNTFASLSQYNTWMDFQYHGHNTSTGAGYQVRWNMIHVSSNAGYGNIAFDLMYETYP